MAMMVIAAGVMAAGQIYQGYAAKVQGENVQRQMDYNAEVERHKAKLKASAISQRGAEKSKVQAKEASRLEGKMLANMAGAGAIPGAGGLAAVLAEQAAESERENMMIGYDTTVASQYATFEGESNANMFELKGDIAKQKGQE